MGAREPIRAEVELTAAAGGLSPPTVSVPEGVRIRVTVRSGDGASHHVAVEAGDPATLRVPAGGRASSLIPGLRVGQKRLLTESGGGRAILRVLAQPGP